jgi:predicted nucleic acid-binding protein
MIATTALQHDLTVAARNPRDFRSAGAKVLNTFS